MLQTDAQPSTAFPKWAKVIDQSTCIGCHACTTACKSENQVPVGVSRTYVKSVDVGEFPQARRAFQVTRCNQCEDAPCAKACPTGAMHRRADGIVDFNKDVCIGCKACVAACPYDAIFINPEDHSAEKCNFCAHRLDVGLEPACVVVCPTQSIFVGDLNDPESRVARTVKRDVVSVRKPEKDTRPKLFYKAAHQATLDPLAAQRPQGGLFMWAQQLQAPDAVVSGHPARGNSSAAVRLSYDQPHRMPWDWRVSGYTWTKNIASGVYLVPLFLVLLGLLEPANAVWEWAAPVLGGLFLAATGLLLIFDLEHPERFWMIFTRPQWRSWLVRGGVILVLYSLLLLVHFIASIAGDIGLQHALMWPGIVLSILCSVYTAFLFAQSRARDLWQNPLLAPHLLVQAVLSGAAVLLPLAAWLAASAVVPLLWTLATASLVHLLFVGTEAVTAHATAHARLAAWEMIRGRYRRFFWAGILLGACALCAPWAGWGVFPLALAGLLAYEHAYVQAAQSVPLA